MSVMSPTRALVENIVKRIFLANMVELMFALITLV